MKNFRCLALAIVAFFATSMTYASNATEIRPSVVPFTIELSGNSPRPIVTALFNGHAMRMFIHSDLAFFAQLRHSDAAAFGVVLAGGHQKFGIDREGHVSELGLDNGTVASLKVGESENKDVPVGVFEIPQSDFGMLGIGWINQNRVILDYGRKQATIAPTPDQAQIIGSELRKAGYVAIPMTFDEHYQHYVVRATINGVTRSMTVGTASPFLIDAVFADAAGAKRGPSAGHGGGPTGTQVEVYPLDAPVRISIDGWTSPEISVGMIMDLYGYGARQRPADPADGTGGYLGGDFLQKTDAVVDFATHTLFVRGNQNP
jgi:hypothetical protein